jgi:hypothetical protein
MVARAPARGFSLCCCARQTRKAQGAQLSQGACDWCKGLRSAQERGGNRYLGMCDRFADTGILENLLLSEQLALTSKRNMLLVSKFFHEFTDAHLRLPELYVGGVDCTISNARFVMRVLVPRVPGLLVCARGEMCAPKMNLAALARYDTVIAHWGDCSIDTTAAFFLGHALAVSDGFVRLGMGRKKSLTALRERDHLELDIYEQANTVDLLLMKPCLLANAERRLDAFDGLVLDLSNLYLNDEEMALVGHKMRDVFDQQHHYNRIDLSCNSFGATHRCGAMRLVVDALCNFRTGGCVHVGALNLSETHIGSEGVRVLAQPMCSGLLKIKQLYLSNAHIDNEGLVCLLRALRSLQGRRLRLKQFAADCSGALEVLDLSENWFSDEGFQELLVGTGLSRLRALHLNKLYHVSKSAMVTLASEVRTGLYPAIAEIQTSYSEDNLPMQKAVRHWSLRRDLAECDSDWNRFRTRFEAEEERWGTPLSKKRRRFKAPIHDA